MPPLEFSAATRDVLWCSVREFGLDLGALIWPTQCVSCGSADRDCCASCRAKLLAHIDNVIEAALPSQLRVCAASSYEAPMKSLVLAVKHAGMTGFTKVIAPRMIAPLRRLTAGLEGTVMLVGAPSRAQRVRERGYRHVELLIRAVLRVRTLPVPSVSAAPFALIVPLISAATSSAPVVPATCAQPVVAPLRLVHLRRALRASAGRTAQVGLSAEARRKNAEQVTVSRHARSRLFGAQVILVDDVVTTGATVTAAANALTAAGAQVIGAISVCLVQRRDETYRETPQFGSGDSSPEASKVPTKA